MTINSFLIRFVVIRRNRKKSNELHYELYPIYNPLYRDGNPAGVKECMQQIGLCSNKLRLPLVNVEESTKNELEEFSNSLKTS